MFRLPFAQPGAGRHPRLRAENAARKMIEEDPAGFRCSLTNARVSKLGDMKIAPDRGTYVRMDSGMRQQGLWRLAMCIEKAGLNYLGIFID